MGKITSSMLAGAPFFSDPLGSLKNSLVDILGFNVEIWQIILVGVLVVALIAVLIVALVKPRKKSKERIKQFVENEENAYRIKKQLAEKQSEINEIRHVLNKRQFEYNRSVKKVKDDYNAAHSREDREFFVATEKLNSINENLRDLSVRLKKAPKGEALSALQAEFDKADTEHSAFAEKYSALRLEKNKRDEEYKNELKKLEDEFTFVKDDYEADIEEKTKEIKKLEAELDKLESTKIKISPRDADAILEEFRKQEELDKAAKLKQAEDDVEKAKNEYIDAQNLRIQYERDRIEAVNSAKEDSARKATLEAARKETEAKVRYGAPSAYRTDEEETEQISDIIKKSDDEKVAREYIEEVRAESDLGEAAYNPDAIIAGAATEIADEEISATENENENNENGENSATEYQPNAIDALEELEQGMNDVDKKNREEVVSEVTEAEEAATETEQEEQPVSAPISEEEKTEQPDNSAPAEEETAAKDGEENIIAENASEESENAIEEPASEIADENDTITEEIEDKSEEAENAEENESADETDETIFAEAAEELADDDKAAAANEESVTENENKEPAAADDSENGNAEPVTEQTEEIAATETAGEETANTVKTEYAHTETDDGAATGEIAAENEKATEASESANEEKIIRMPKVIYNDGIPATPIHKKSKFSKPVTKILVKKAPVKDETPEETPVKEETRKSAYLGKWKTETTEDGKTCAKLCASNGGVLLVTPAYTSDIGLKNGIASIKKHLASGNVTISANKAGKFVFKITAPSGRTIVTSEQYGARFQCEKALESAKRFAESAVIVE